MPAPSTDEAREVIKARGAFYTAPAIATFLSRWALRKSTDRVLEPSCGDGVFLTAATERLEQLGGSPANVVGVELKPDEVAKAKRLAPAADVRVGSFFEVAAAEVGPVEAVIGNPPYIRYHQWSGDNRSSGMARAAELGVEIGSLASSWAPFVIHAASFLRPAGRLALVLPAELLHTDYARPVREFLLGRFTSVVVIAFDQLVFANAQVDAVLLLASNDDADGLRVLRLKDERALEDIGATGLHRAAGGNGYVPRHRWSAAVDADAAALYSGLIASGKYQRLGEIASVDIGYVSGGNSYFVLKRREAEAAGLPERALMTTVEKPSDLRGLRVTDDEVRLLFRPDDEAAQQPAVGRYLQEGVRLGIDARYKPRHRRPWYRVPLPHQVGDLLLPYMSHHTPLLIVNPGARSTNLVHSVRLCSTKSIDPRVLSAYSLSSVWALSTEIEGRSYGGGVLKLETTEAERLLVPPLDDASSPALLRLFDKLDGLVRSGKRSEATVTVDSVLGTESPDVAEAASVFRARRQARGSSRRKP